MYVSGQHVAKGFTLLRGHLRLQHTLADVTCACISVLWVNLYVQYTIVLKAGTPYVFISHCQLKVSEALKNNRCVRQFLFCLKNE